VREGYTVLQATDGPAALRAFRSQAPDLIVLDLHLPGLDGTDVARAIRRESTVPIIMLTARADESDKLTGLDLGADDYVTKPFSPRELVARIRAVLRRTHDSAGERADAEIIRVTDLEIDTGAHEVRRGNGSISLTSYQFDLLAALARNPGQVMSRDQLLEVLSEHDAAPFDRTVDAHMKNLRKALGDDAASPRYIETIRGVGYRLLKGR